MNIINNLCTQRYSDAYGLMGAIVMNAFSITSRDFFSSYKLWVEVISCCFNYATQFLTLQQFSALCGGHTIYRQYRRQHKSNRMYSKGK